MNDKPIIAINADFRAAKSETFSFSWMHTGYYDSVSNSGGIPLMLPPMAEDDDLRRMLEQVDGLVLTGCKLDLDPIRLGFDPHPVTRAMPARREDFDRRLAKLAYEMKIPTLAIGSGMQVLNLICGGTLFQHVAEDVYRSLCHRDAVENCLRHVIEIVPGTKMDSIYGPGEIRVNSDHHMAIDQLASVFRASATAMDGVVEAYESTDDNWWCLGTQFHPESESASALDLQVFEAFIDGAKEQTATGVEILQFDQTRRVA
ncbi:putative glutamine amidotransferase [Thalassoglobus neptunius]|uniref:Putative glutamine amidotransferase n=1 Tax=Thalassoglobus neptunius TaxID=1938619 RepID=A0A5C5X6I0_9PLAN|nr:gamma-glutamyl-gamma-aminobutyrate hydrolase family protein [Thalassoglobus neptunius]TWT57951.1 putative glutamine amidotransferase [Thalassoglobus neptunius]